ncbi:MAG: protein-L-isoaspartate(D-aspartate) O-methyltransferase [Bryobacterales bacterium]|nr:protein-L-isoaspartate(D-aspartate) O-methyltransferase [Bryobacterales bacterium]
MLLSPVAAADAFSELRERMVREQIEGRGIRNAAVLGAMRSTPRHEFIPKGAGPAYADHPLPIGFDATISQPYVVALMTELLKPEKTHRILEVGTGSGYQAAVVSQLVSWVYTIEIVPELARSARENLARLGYANITVRPAGDGFAGWPERAPFEGILMTAAPVEIPAALIAQLANGGRLVAPVGPSRFQDLVLVEKSPEGKIRRSSYGGVSFVPMRRK